MAKQQLEGNKRVIEDLVFDPMKIKASMMAEYARCIASPLMHVDALAKLMASPGVVVRVPDSWGEFDKSDAAAWAELPWMIFVRVLNDFAYASSNFSET